MKNNTGWIIGGIVAIVIIVLGISSMGNNKAEVAADMAMKEKAMMEEKMMMEKKAMEEKAMMDGKMMEGDKMMTDDKMMQKDAPAKDAMMKDTMTKDAMVKAGTYSAYSAEKLAMAKDGKVVLFFKASWCPSCRALDANIKSNLSAIPARTHILEVDYDASAEMKKKYGVTSQHTLVQVDATGNLIAKWQGGNTLTALVQNIK